MFFYGLALSCIALLLSILITDILISGIIFLTINDMGGLRWYKLYTKRSQIKYEIKSLIQQQSHLEEEIDRLNNDPNYIKKIAQEKFHMVKPGEKVFRVIDKTK